MTDAPAAPPVAETHRIHADFLDGKSARSHRVELQIDETLRALTMIHPDGAVVHWPLGDMRAMPDHADPEMLVLTELHHGTDRLVVKHRGAVKHLREVCPNLKRKPPTEGHRRLFLWAGGALASVAVMVFLLIPLLANNLATILPPEGEKALGDATFEQIRQALGGDGFAGVEICETADGLAALQVMQDRVMGDLDLPYELTVHVLDHPMVNAFALPGGHVVFFDGLIQAADHPDEVAAVFAHEIGHVAARDPTRIALRTAGSVGVIGLLFGDFAGGAVMLMLANQLIQATYTQDAEAGADAFAHQRLRAAGIPPSALAGLFKTLRDQHGDSDGLMEHFASHPQLGDRIEAAITASQGMPETTKPSLTDEEWNALRQVCS